MIRKDNISIGELQAIYKRTGKLPKVKKGKLVGLFKKGSKEHSLLSFFDYNNVLPLLKIKLKSKDESRQRRLNDEF